MAFNPATNPFEHAARVLSLDAVLELLAVHCVNEGTRRAARAATPTADVAAIERSLEEIAEYAALREQSGDIVIPDTSYRADVEAIANGARGFGDALRRIADGERAIAALRRAVGGESAAFPRLSAIASGASPHHDFVAEADRALEPDGTIKDDATPELRDHRRAIRGLRTTLRGRVEKLVGEIGADAHATVSGSRHVLVVPRAKVRKGSGFVHGASHSGGSLYVEPIALLELNNDLETRLADEAEEIERILESLSARVRAVAPAILVNADVVESIDLVRAKEALSARFGCIAPEISSTGRLRLVRARHPLLSLALERAGRLDQQVPLDLVLEPGERLMIITGPNAGGKTVALKTVGLVSLLFQCGLRVPCAHGTEVPVFGRVFADIGDEQSLESSLSTFTSHLRHLDEMARHADARSLCLVDEIGDGTDPDEGAAIAIAALERMLVSGAAVIATTHYGRIKTFALETAGVANASMAFADESSRPLYRLMQGIAGRSRGIDTARRTGFDPKVVARAEAILGGEAFRMESALARLEASYQNLQTERSALEQARIRLEEATRSYEEKERAYALTKKEASKKAMREAETMLTDARKEIEGLVRDIRTKGADKETIRHSRKKVDDMLADVRGQAQALEPKSAPLTRVSPGDRVSLSPTGRPFGTVVEVDRKDVTVDMGGKKIRARVGKLYPAAGDEVAVARTGVDVQFEPVGETEVSVRGMDRESALEEVSRFIDRAVLTGLSEVKIIHGLGTGVLAKAVRESLARDPRVVSHRTGNPMEGGTGVTFARLK
ncbi:MAG: Smr/MutS family protein [Candidatus Latescibacteria bacterium]|nr:Smr/MutS family protein [Candidatus Latescibacterota bacterium]